MLMVTLDPFFCSLSKSTVDYTLKMENGLGMMLKVVHPLLFAFLCLVMQAVLWTLVKIMKTSDGDELVLPDLTPESCDTVPSMLTLHDIRSLLDRTDL